MPLTVADLQRSGVLDELAKVFNDVGAAHELLERIEFPLARRPVFANTRPIWFWREVCQEIENGLTKGGLRRLLDVASARYPGNLILRGMSPSFHTTPPVGGGKVPPPEEDRFPDPAYGDTQGQAKGTPRVPRVSAIPTGLEFRIRKSSSPTPLSYELELHAPDSDLDIYHRTFGPIVLESDPARYFAEFFKKIQDLPTGPGSPWDIAGDLEDLGSLLYEHLIPRELGEVLTSLLVDDSCVRTLQIQSDEPWIPWELLRLPRTRGHAPFLCEAFATSRWLGDRSPLRELPLRRMAVVAPRNTDLAWVADELEFLLGLADGGREVRRIEARKRTILAALSSASYDGWHFSGHALPKADPNDAEILIEDYEKVTPWNLVGDARDFGETRPLVFLNGCHTGRAGMSLTAVGGWAQAFLKGGAGAFLGTYWTIRDDGGARFARRFYENFVAGTPIAEAVRRARLSIRTPDDPSWLAYTIYAHPLAFCSGVR